MPVGFKNSTNGNVKTALDAIISAQNPHCFMGISAKGEPSICKTKGNQNTHVILRGSSARPNYYPEDVFSLEKQIDEYNKKENKGVIEKCVIIDCSHGNSERL